MLLPYLLSLVGEGSLPASSTLPSIVVALIENIYPADHGRMLVTAVFGAEQMITTGLGCRKPDGVVMPGHYVVFDSECRNREAMDYVLRGHGQLHRLAHRDMQFIDLPPAIRVVDLPHTLLAGHNNLH